MPVSRGTESGTEAVVVTYAPLLSFTTPFLWPTEVVTVTALMAGVSLLFPQL